jgi:signal transduction histidine kinase
VDARTIPEGIELVIRDNGRGISPDDLLHVFEPYFSKGVDKWPASMGLGLSTVDRLLGELNWQKQIDSEVGIGTKFYITIPKEAVV